MERRTYSSFQESRISPRDLRLISGIQSHSALLSVKTSADTYQSIRHPLPVADTQSAAASYPAARTFPVWPFGQRAVRQAAAVEGNFLVRNCHAEIIQKPGCKKFGSRRLTKPLFSEHCCAEIISDDARRGFPFRCAEETVGPHGFSAAPFRPELRQAAVARGKIGVLRLEKEQQLWGKMLAMCKADQGLFWRKNVLTQDFHEKKVTEEHGMQRPEAVHRSNSSMLAKSNSLLADHTRPIGKGFCDSLEAEDVLGTRSAWATCTSRGMRALVSSAFPKAWKNTLTKNQTWWVMKAKIVYPDHINRKMIFTQQLFYQQIKAPVLVLGTGVCCNFCTLPSRDLKALYEQAAGYYPNSDCCGKFRYGGMGFSDHMQASVWCTLILELLFRGVERSRLFVFHMQQMYLQGTAGVTGWRNERCRPSQIPLGALPEWWGSKTHCRDRKSLDVKEYLQRCKRITYPDQTPTPTRFLKNCEEVGLFNDIDCSLEHEFRKAQEEENNKRQGLLQEQVPWPSNEIHIGEVILCQVLFIINWQVLLFGIKTMMVIVIWRKSTRYELWAQKGNWLLASPLSLRSGTAAAQQDERYIVLSLKAVLFLSLPNALYSLLVASKWSVVVEDSHPVLDGRVKVERHIRDHCSVALGNLWSGVFNLEEGFLNPKQLHTNTLSSCRQPSLEGSCVQAEGVCCQWRGTAVQHCRNISMHNTVGGAMAGPGSHQLTNTRMPNHDTSVVIQQAMPSPQSSSVITQAPSTNRQIGGTPSKMDWVTSEGTLTASMSERLINLKVRKDENIGIKPYYPKQNEGHCKYFGYANFTCLVVLLTTQHYVRAFSEAQAELTYASKLHPTVLQELKMCRLTCHKINWSLLHLTLVALTQCIVRTAVDAAGSSLSEMPSYSVTVAAPQVIVHVLLMLECLAWQTWHRKEWYFSFILAVCPGLGSSEGEIWKRKRGTKNKTTPPLKCNEADISESLRLKEMHFVSPLVSHLVYIPPKSTTSMWLVSLAVQRVISGCLKVDVVLQMGATSAEAKDSHAEGTLISIMFNNVDCALNFAKFGAAGRPPRIVNTTDKGPSSEKALPQSPESFALRTNSKSIPAGLNSHRGITA
ncbi:cAMP response element-binding protein 5 [Anas platyrhynchos]|uniref:cAMP response element-binding protein 5 n=2 Tax=Galloanserae TaxID=1549675 RepID=R0L681_ANAPL|nr:cAMP response element-binding protein 5 [Anas platyrhynchos]